MLRAAVATDAPSASASESNEFGSDFATLCHCHAKNKTFLLDEMVRILIKRPFHREASLLNTIWTASSVKVSIANKEGVVL